MKSNRLWVLLVIVVIMVLASVAPAMAGKHDPYGGGGGGAYGGGYDRVGGSQGYQGGPAVSPRYDVEVTVSVGRYPTANQVRYATAFRVGQGYRIVAGPYCSPGTNIWRILLRPPR